MSTINERIRDLRKHESMTMDKFGERLGVSKSAISEIENGRRNPSNQLFNSICREFSVNPDWLRDGSGEMFKEKSRNDEIAAFIDDILKNEPDGVKAHMIAALARLDDRDWVRIAEVAQALVSEQNAEKAAAETQHAEPSAAETQRETEREKLHEELDRQLDLEEDTQRSSGSSVG